MSERLIYATSFILVALGFVLPLWPLSLGGILLATFSGRYIFGVAVALLLDVAWGAPTGLAQYLFFPMTALAFVSIVLRVFASRYLLSKDIPEHL